MTKKFKKGDIVLCHCESSFYHLGKTIDLYGKIGEIVKYTDYEGSTEVIVKFGDISTTFFEKWLRKIILCPDYLHE